MADWKPKVRADLRWESLNLTAEEGFLLSRIDGLTSVQELTHLTGLSRDKVAAALDKLADTGALETAPRAHVSMVQSPSRPVPVSFDEAPDTAGEDRIHDVGDIDDIDDINDINDINGDVDDINDDDEALIQAALAEAGLFDDDGDDTDEGAAVGSMMDADSVEADDEYAADDVRAHPDLEADLDGGGDSDASDASDASVKNADDTNDGDGDEADKGDEEEEGAEDIEAGNSRKLFEMTLHPLPLEEREAGARDAVGAVALAYCFDPVPNVIARLMENSEVGFPHARLIARHHRTSQGLDGLFKRSELVRDQQVQRWLMANPMLNDAQLKRLLGPKILSTVYKWALSRDLPEKNRTKVRLILRSKWSVADGEERANLIFQTDGRCLSMLIGLQLDSKATTLLCQRSINSVMLIQSLCRFTSTPPPVLAHLSRQALVKRQANLRTLIVQHPNCPSEIKRSARAPARS